MEPKVIGLGAGGHARVIIEILKSHTSYELIGLLDANPELQGKKILDVPVIGDDNLLSTLRNDGVTHFFVGLGGVGNTKPRRNLYNLALQHNMKPINVIHPQTVISPTADFGAGVTIMAGAVVNTCVHLGANVIVNTGAIIEHDCIIGDHAHIATGVQLASTVRVADGVHVGIGATVKQCVAIGEYAIVGAGAVVVNDIPSHTVVVGIPARPLRGSGSFKS